VAPLELTQALAPTQRVEVVPPVKAAPSPAAVSAAAALIVAKRVVTAPIVQVPVVKAPVVAAPPAAETSVAEPPAAGPQGGWGGQRRLKPILLVALLVGVLGAAYLLSPMGDPGTTTASPPSTHPSASARPTAANKPNAPEAPRASTPAPGGTVAPTTLNADRQLADFVSSYYANVTGNRDITWAQLSPMMQAFARGRSDYEGFWQTIRTVRVNQVRADAAARTAVVSLTYTKSNGSTTNETHNFTFVRNGTGYLIQSDR
jgi:hypothetical protein